ncbi:MAG: hypothetical protein HY000_34280 [Planctomycetes bacterium]|nr:hypothetical protein [Planctomycetota bacterium]
MSTTGKVLVWTIAVLSLPFMILSAMVLNIQNQWRTRVDNPTAELDPVLERGDLFNAIEDQVWTLPEEPSPEVSRAVVEGLMAFNRQLDATFFRRLEREVRRSPRLDANQRQSTQSRLSQISEQLAAAGKQAEQLRAGVGDAKQAREQLLKLTQAHREALDSLAGVLHQALPALGMSQQARQAQLEANRTRALVRRIRHQLQGLQHPWGRAWEVSAPVMTDAQKGVLTIEKGQRDGLVAKQVLHAFAGVDQQPTYLGQFMVSALTENSGTLTLSPEPDSDGNGLDAVEQEDVNARLELLRRAADARWLLRTNLTGGYTQALQNWNGLATKWRANRNAAEHDRDTWAKNLQEAQQDLARRREDVDKAVADLAEAEQQRNDEVEQLYKVRGELAGVTGRFTELAAQNKRLARRIAQLEEQLAAASRGATAGAP